MILISIIVYTAALYIFDRDNRCNPRCFLTVHSIIPGAFGFMVFVIGTIISERRFYRSTKLSLKQILANAIIHLIMIVVAFYLMAYTAHRIYYYDVFRQSLIL